MRTPVPPPCPPLPKMATTVGLTFCTMATRCDSDCKTSSRFFAFAQATIAKAAKQPSNPKRNIGALRNDGGRYQREDEANASNEQTLLAHACFRESHVVVQVEFVARANHDL